MAQPADTAVPNAPTVAFIICLTTVRGGVDLSTILMVPLGQSRKRNQPLILGQFLLRLLNEQIPLLLLNVIRGRCLAARCC